VIKNAKRLPFDKAINNLRQAKLIDIDIENIYGIDSSSWDKMPLLINLSYDKSDPTSRYHLKTTGFFLEKYHIEHCFDIRKRPVNLKDELDNFTVKGKK
jgi:hypothetical protein